MHLASGLMLRSPSGKGLLRVCTPMAASFFVQIFGAGRAATGEDVIDMVGVSAIPIDADHRTPRELTDEEIWDLVGQFAQAAKNVMEAGFDGVEIHGAYSELIDQFIHESSNQRTDVWGGSIENRSRFPIEVAKAVVGAVGKERVGMRFTPFGKYLSMDSKDRLGQFTHLITELKRLDLAYLHLVEPRVDGISDVATADSLDPLVALWMKEEKDTIFLAGGYNPDTAKEAVDGKYRGKNVFIVFGRHFTANPDLVYRIRKGIPLTKYDRSTFYKVKSPDGYADWPFSDEFVAEKGFTL